MALITISSKDRIFSYDLNKNPDSGLQAKALKEGTLFGFYSRKGLKFNLLFQDNPLTCSFFSDQSHQSLGASNVEYNDLNRYVNPYVYLKMLELGIQISETNLNQHSDIDYEIVLHSVLIEKPHVLKLLQEDLAKTMINLTYYSLPRADKIYNITLQQKAPHIIELLKVTKLLLLLTGNHRDGEAFDLNDEQKIKYLKYLQSLDCNYQLRNIFKINYLTPSLFAAHRTLIETSNKYKSLNLNAGSNKEQRKEFLLTTLNSYKNLNIVDLGAGESAYFKALYKKIARETTTNEFSYHAIDTNINVLDELRFIAEKQKFMNLFTYENLNAFIMKADHSSHYTIICSECLEHNSLNDIKELLKTLNILKSFTLVITTPNKAFNAYYNLTDLQYRDEDHKYEFTYESLQEVLNECFINTRIRLGTLGDRVNGISSSLVAEVNKN